MQPKIAYLIDDNTGWLNEGPDWKFYTEDDVPQHRIKNKGGWKRIVYWEVEEDV